MNGKTDLRNRVIKNFGVFAPSLPSSGERRVRIEKALQSLRESGYSTTLGKTTFSESGPKSASGRERARDLESLFLNDKVDAILCTTGGYSSIEMLSELDFDLLSAHPKPLIGYSDVTVLLFALFCRCMGEVYLGPMLVDAVEDPLALQTLLSGLGQPTREFVDPELRWETGREGKEAAPRRRILPGRETSAEGWVLAGNLSTAALMLGTDFFPDVSGSVLFLEYDREERRALLSLERLLWQFRLSGVFSSIKGLVFGSLEHSVGEEESALYNIERILSDVTEGFSFPVLFDVHFGHIYPSQIIPIGRPVTLEGTRIVFS